MNIELIKYPTEEDWKLCKILTLNTIGKNYSGGEITQEWKEKILKAGHSPIRCLPFAIKMEIPYWISVHYVRHKIGVEHFVQSQRNDRQEKYDRNLAPQGQLVSHIMYLNAEALINISHKRLCNQASVETREAMKIIRDKVVEVCPEFKNLLVPMCVYRNGLCTEFFSCNKSVNK